MPVPSAKAAPINEEYPRILTPWISTYRSCPKLNIPGTSLGLAYTLASAALLISLRLVMDQFFSRVLGWPAGARITTEAAACFVSGLQASIFVPSLGACLVAEKFRPSARMDASPRWWQDAAKALIEYCTGYMLYDGIMVCVDCWVPGEGLKLDSSDVSFIGHHIATSLYMGTALIQGAGHMSAMILMFLGEFTSPFMNAHSVLKFAVKFHTAPLVHDLLMYSEFAFALLYIPCRAVLGPLAAAINTYELIFTKAGRKNCRIWLSLLWMPMCWGVLVGSIPWIKESIELVQDGLEVKYGADYDYGEKYVHHHTDL